MPKVKIQKKENALHPDTMENMEKEVHVMVWRTVKEEKMSEDVEMMLNVENQPMMKGLFIVQTQPFALKKISTSLKHLTAFVNVHGVQEKN